MKDNDVNLIQRTLEGDQQAFTDLVEKYQKQIHALAWQKIGDFHIAQEITQDAFLTAYQNSRRSHIIASFQDGSMLLPAINARIGTERNDRHFNLYKQ